jgi:acetoacetate decarboxylase
VISTTRGPLNRFELITPSDTVDLSRYTQTKQLTDGIYIGGSGSIVAMMADGTTATFQAALNGTILPIGVRRVNATNTTATGLIAVYQI